MGEYNYMNQQMTEPLKHSSLGIASFIIGIITGIMEFVCIIASAMLVTTNPESAAMVVVGLLLLAGIIFALVGIGLGIGGLVQKKRKKVFSIIGLILNAFTFIAVVGLMIIGSVV